MTQDEVKQQCPTCGHPQSGYPEGYCEQLVKTGPDAYDLDVCACTDNIHSDHPHRWETLDELSVPTCMDCGLEAGP